MTRHPATARGSSLLLVMIAVAVAGALAYGLLASQATSAQLSRNVRQSAQARLVAEAGLQLTLRYLQSTPDWRDEKAEGV